MIQSGLHVHSLKEEIFLNYVLVHECFSKNIMFLIDKKYCFFILTKTPEEVEQGFCTTTDNFSIEST